MSDRTYLVEYLQDRLGCLTMIAEQLADDYLASEEYQTYLREQV